VLNLSLIDRPLFVSYSNIVIGIDLEQLFRVFSPVLHLGNEGGDLKFIKLSVVDIGQRWHLINAKALKIIE